MVRLLLIFLILTAGGMLFVANYSPDTANAAPIPRVLFVGNSLTMGHSVPGRVSNFALEDGTKIDVRMLARGGAYLKDWAEDPQFQDALANGNWDVVVLQDNSKVALQMEFKVASWQAVADAARMAGQARLVLFSTWPAAKGHGIYTDDWWGKDKPRSPNHFAEMTTKHYQDIANDVGGRVANVTENWMRAENHNALYHPDKVHASVQGAELAAEILWNTIRQELNQ